MKLQFIDDVKGAWKLLSVHVSAFWTALFALFIADPTLFVSAWNAIPEDIRSFLPPWVRWLVVSSAMLGTIFLARVTKQPVTKTGAIAEECKRIQEINPDLPKDEAKQIAAKFVEQDEAAAAKVCDLPPPGWACTRKKGHTGPCATVRLGVEQ